MLVDSVACEPSHSAQPGTLRYRKLCQLQNSHVPRCAVLRVSQVDGVCARYLIDGGRAYLQLPTQAVPQSRLGLRLLSE